MCKAYACMHIMIELACKVCLHMNVHELVYASQLGLPANAMLVCWTQAEHFWGAEGAPILFSEIGFCVASCSYIYNI